MFDANKKDAALAAIEEVIRDAIDLSRPDSLAFLEWQVPDIASEIVTRLGSLDGQQEPIRT